MRAIIFLIATICLSIDTGTGNEERDTYFFETATAMPRTIEIFPGASIDLVWSFDSADWTGNTRIEADLFRVLAATVAPLESGRLLAEIPKAEVRESQVVLFSHAFPDVGPPQKYLVRIRHVSDEFNRVIDTRFVSIVPDDILDKLRGERLRLIVTDESDVSTIIETTLKAAGVSYLRETRYSPPSDTIPTILFANELPEQHAMKPMIVISDSPGTAAVSHKFAAMVSLADFYKFDLRPSAQRRFLALVQLLKQ